LIVAIRLLAIFWLLNVLSQIPIIIVTFENLPTEPSSTVAWVGIQFAISVVLWLFPATFAGMLLRSGGTPVPTAATPFGEWYALSFIAVGIFILGRALPTLAYWLILATNTDPHAEPFTVDQKANFVATFVEIALGVGLVLGARGMSALIQRLRTAGVSAHQ
jgi:hypothetical protein